MFTLVLGGRRSGKSLWAENEALTTANNLQTGSGKMLYLATAPPPLPTDVEMQRRIREHQQRRESQLVVAGEKIGDWATPKLVNHPVANTPLGDHPLGDHPVGPSSGRSKPIHWVTIEEPLNLLACLQKQEITGVDLVFIDCITLWLFNLMQQNSSDKSILQAVEELAQFLAELSLPVFAISNEVGMGVAPATKLGNRFCDLAGRVNQVLAKKANRVVFVISGLPLFLK